MRIAPSQWAGECLIVFEGRSDVFTVYVIRNAVYACAFISRILSLMSYQVLARKWRPSAFGEMVGQEHVLKALINALDNNRLHHAYLFTGTRGVGKTTLARLLAKCLNCEQGVSSKPCEQCTACTEINQGRFVDLLEIDAASRTRVEDTREILDNVQYAPTRARFKVYLIDEVHMLSTHSFNALLKTLEEPPEHVKFLLATTDPQKLPATVLSRCLQFHLKNMQPEQIVRHLAHVLDQEQLRYEEPALWLLGRAAQGSMRDALSLTDQAIAFGSGQLLENDVRNMLGTVDVSFVYQILEHLADAQAEAMLDVVKRMAEHAPDFGDSLDELISLLHRITLAQLVPDVVDNSWGDAERVSAIAKRFSGEDVQLFYQLAINGKRDLPMAADARAGFEMVLLRMLAFRPEAVLDSALNPEDVGEASSAAVSGDVDSPPVAEITSGDEDSRPKKPEVPMSGADDAPPWDNSPTLSKTAPTQPFPSAEKPENVATTRNFQNDSPPAIDNEGVVGDIAANTQSEVLKEREDSVSDTAVPSISHDASNEIAAPAKEASPAAKALVTIHDWYGVLSALQLRGMLYNTASHCALERIEGDQLHFVLDDQNAGLYREDHQAQIQQALCDYLGRELSIHIVKGSPKECTPAVQAAKDKALRQEQAVEAILQDDKLQQFIAHFEGELVRDSIAPIQ